ncbi:hypothetical protein PVAP13_5NG012590 [Panicum virgatum]|uniref:Uncharacterized protein n=1 Tax=Panicum virgatum TaxID=38727 RepID=A0A8T0S969_PANVG|nr:hypothetical protein PVAP13_5NG012590 [Panicum virgatum]
MKDPFKLQTNVGCSDNDENDENYIDSEYGEYIDDEDISDEDDSETSDEDDDANFPMNAKDKNRATETPLKTPPKKKAGMTTPSKGNNTVMKCYF